MTIARVGSASGVATTSAFDTTGANLIIISIAYDGTRTVSDNKFNTWTPLTQQGPALGGVSTYTRLYYCYNPTVGSGHTFSVDLSYAAIAVIAFSGAASSPFDLESGQAITSAVTSAQPGSITPSSNNEVLVVGMCVGGTTSTYSVNSSFTLDQSINAAPGVTYGSALAYKIQTTAGAENPTISWSGSNNASISMATFKAASTGTVALSGVAGTLGTSNLTPAIISKALTSVAATSAVGNITVPPATFSLTGVSATGAVGNVLIAGGTLALTGVVGTTSTGTLGAAISKALSGVSATSAVGTLGLGGVSLALTGAAASGATGTFSVAIDKALTGVSGTGSVGNVSVGGTTQAISGVQASGGTGNISVTISKALLGLGATSATGTISPLTGSYVTVKAGSWIRYRKL